MTNNTYEIYVSYLLCINSSSEKKQNVSYYINNTAHTSSTAILDSVVWITMLPIHEYENLLSSSNISPLNRMFPHRWRCRSK